MSLLTRIRNGFEDAAAGAAAGWLVGGPLGAVGGAIFGGVEAARGGNLSQTTRILQSATGGAAFGLVAAPSALEVHSALGAAADSPFYVGQESLLPGFGAQLEAQASIFGEEAVTVAGSAADVLSKATTGILSSGGALSAAAVGFAAKLAGTNLGTPNLKVPVASGIPTSSGGSSGPVVLPVQTSGSPVPVQAGFSPMMAIAIIGAALGIFWLFRKKK